MAADPAPTDPPDRSPVSLFDLIDAFEEAWQRGERPDITAFLPSEAEARRQVLPHLVHIDLEWRLKAGEAVRVEEYLQGQRFPELRDDAAQLLSLVRAEYQLRKRRERVERTEFLQRFPQFSDQLQSPPTIPDAALTAPETTTHHEPVLPKQFGRYRIERVLGRGNMGAVYVAYDTHLERHVALKVPRCTAADSPAMLRFRREAKIAGSLHHPNICPFYDAGEIEGISYLTMALVTGRALTEAHPPPLEPRQAAALVRQLALALQEAHEHGVVHRDLKPANILINHRGEPVIMDFGLALRGEDIRLTNPGAMIGTPAYMAPEQARGMIEAMGPGCDIYSLGVILYELLTDHLPFETPLPSLFHQLFFEPPPPLTQWRADLDPRLEQVCLKALAKRPEQRHASMAAFAQELADWLAGTGVPPPQPAPPAEPERDPRVAEDVLRLLRTWGWERGLEQMKQRISAADDPGRRADLRVLLGWLAGDRGHHSEALAQLREAESWPTLAGWARAGQAMIALRERNFRGARELLDSAANAAGRDDRALQASLAHTRGTLAYQEGRTAEALAQLHTALELYGPTDFGAGRVLDTLGMVHANRGNVAAAVEFYQEALATKQRCNDETGIALTHGQLGRLHLAWEQLDQAEEQFRASIALARQTGDERGEAQMHNHRGQVLLARGQPVEALTLLNESIRAAQGRWSLIEGYARKDRALAHLALGETDLAEQQCQHAEKLFQSVPFAEGLAHVRRVRGLVCGRLGRHGEAVEHLEAAAAHFTQSDAPGDAAAVLRDLAQQLRAQGAAPLKVAEVLETALDRAEQSRRSGLVAAVEAELRGVREAAQLRRTCRRLRGAGWPEETAELFRHASEAATVLAVELRLESEEGGEVAALRNHLYADLQELPEWQQVRVCQFWGDGFVALAQGRDHAGRGVTAALALARALHEINRPRRVLKWPLWHLFAGLDTGIVSLGNAGTYQKLTFAASGPPVSVATRLLTQAEADLPCLSEEVHRLVAARFVFAAGNPRSVSVKGSVVPVWDVVRVRE